MKRVQLILGAMIAVFLQMSIVPMISIGSMIPNVVVVWFLVVYDRSHRMDLVYAALVAGVLLDLNFAHSLGLHSFVLVLWMYFMTQRFFRDFPAEWYNRLLIWIVACLAYHVMYAGVLYLMGYPVTWGLLFQRLLSWEIVANMALALLAYSWSRHYRSKSLKWFRM